MLRLKHSQIDIKIQVLREELKNAESSGNDLVPLMQKIEELQTRKNNIL